MMKLVFLISAWLIYEVRCSSDSQNLAEEGVESILERISENILTSLTNSLTKSLSTYRQKRHLVENLSQKDDSGVYRLKGLKPVAKLCYPAIQTLFLQVSNMTYAVCVSAQTDNPAELIIGTYEGHTWFPFYRRFINNHENSVAFQFNNYFYVLFADKEKKSGTDLIKIDLKTKVEAKPFYSPTSNYPTRIAVWNMKVMGTYNLAIANSNGNYDASDLTSEVVVFYWKDTYFDRYSAFEAFDVRDIEPFFIHDAAYLAIANFRRGKDKNEVDSEILRYDLENAWVSHQKIRTYGAVDWEFFSLGASLGQEFFLVLANQGIGGKNARSIIYKFVDDKFVPFQCLQTTKATSISSYSKGDAFVLAVANEDDAVHLYQYDGWRFVMSGVQYTTGAMAYGVKHLKLYEVTSDSKSVLILSVSNPISYEKSVFEIELAHENSMQEWHKRSTDWCLNTLSKLETADIDQLIGSFDDVIFTDQKSVTIDGDVVFEGGFVADTLKTPKLTAISTQEVFDNNLLNKLADLQGRLKIVEQKLKGFSGVLENALKIDGNQTISSSLEFKDAEFDCRKHTCHFENIYTSVLNQESVTDWRNQLVFLDTEQFINETLWANQINASSIHVQGLIDGVHSQTLVTKSGDHTIEGRKEFNNIFARDLQVSGKVDGIAVSPANVLITTGLQRLQGDITFDDVDTTWLYAAYVNGKNLSHFYNDMVLTDKPHTITGLKTFSDVTIDDLFMIPGSKINGVDLVDLWENALWINGTQEIKAEITFSDVMFKNLKVSEGINGVQIPGPRVVDITENAVITSPQVFSNSTEFGHLEIRSSLNEVKLVQAPDGSKQLDIMLKTGDQIVQGRKTFHTIHLGDNSEVRGTVDGVDLSEFKASVLRNDTSVKTNATFFFNNLEIRGPLTVEGLISGVKIEDIYRRALKLNETNISEMIFNDVVYVTDLQSNNINGINVRTDLVLKKEPQTLTGNFTFTEIEIEENARILGLVNGRDFSFLNEILLRIGDQRIKSKVFKRNIKIKNLTVKGFINGLPVSDIVTVKGGQISGTRTLSNVTFSKIQAKNVEVTGRVNAIDLDEMIRNTMTSDGNEVVTGEKNINGTIYVLNGTDFSTGNLNGINMKTLLEDAVLVDIPQTIIGEKLFQENVVFNNLTFFGNINGVSDWEIKDWMLTDVPQTVDGSVLFQNGFSAKDLQVNSVNGLDLKFLESDIVKVNEETEIKGSVIFDKSVISEENINLLGRIQGIDLSEEAVLKDKVVVESAKTFTQDLVFEGDLTVDGTVDGIDVNDLCSKTFVRNRDVNITKLVIKGNVFLLDDLAVGGNLAGINISLFKDIAIASNEPEIKFSGVKKFTNLTLSGPVLLRGNFGGVDLQYLNAYYMSLSRDQEIPAKMTFDELLFKGILSVNNLNTANNEINNINIHELNNKILKTHGTQNVIATYHIDEVHFASDVFVGGKVNGLKLPEGVMRRNHTNFIQSPKIFQQTVIVRGDLEMEVGRTIQDVDVSDWYQKSVLKRGQFHISGIKTFNNLELNDIIVEGTMDGLKISENDLLMSYGDQVITKRKLIQGDVTIEGSLTVNGEINNVNLTLISLETLQRDRDNTITGFKHFTKPLTIVSLEAPSVAGVDIVKVKEKLNSSVNLDSLERKIGELEGVVEHMQNAFENQAVLFQYYELFDEFDISSVYDSLYISGPDCPELLLLMENSGSSEHCSTVKIFGYDRQINRFIPTRQELPTSYAVSVESLTLNGVTNLFVANQDPCCSCLGNYNSGGSASIDIYSWNISRFVKVESLEIHEPTSMVVFQDKGLACIVILEAIASKVFCSSQSRYNFTEIQSLSTTGGQQVAILKSQGRIILAIAAQDNSYATQNYVEGQSSVDIYLWSSSEGKFVYTKQILRSTSPQSIALMNYDDERSESVFLVVAEGKIRKIYNEPKLLVYRLDFSDIFEEYQEIKDNGILEWITLYTGELIFFAVDPLQGLINVYQYKGASGFVKIDTIKSFGVKKIRPFIRSDPEDWLNHYLVLAGYDCKPQTTRNGYYAKILKSKVKGKRPLKFY